MDTPDVTKVQGGAAAAFAGIVALAITSDLTDTALAIVVLGSALVAAASMVCDAMIRKGRAGILASELHGLQANAAVFGGQQSTSDEAA